MFPAEENFAKWADALGSRAVKKITHLYADGATLIPTMAPRVIAGQKGIEEYFTFFLSLSPTVSILEEQMTPLADESYLHCGIYRFALVSGEKEEILDARFTMVWQKTAEGWRILHHHSSGMPVV